MKYILRNIKYVDLFEKPVKLLIKKEEGHKTILGAVLSLSIIGIILILLIDSLQTLYKRESPTSLQTEAFLQAPPLFILKPQNFTFQIGVESSNYTTYIDESILIINGTYRRLLTEIQADGSSIQVNRDQQIPLARCNKSGIIQQSSLNGFFQQFDGAHNLCIDWTEISQLSIQGKFGNPNYEFLEFTVNICSNKTKRWDGPPCKDRNTILQSLQQNYLSFQISNNILNLKDFNQPFQPEGQDLFTKTSGSISKEIQLQMQPVETITDDGFITSTSISEKTIRFHQMAEFLDINSGLDQIALVSIILTQYESLNYRSYPKFQEILGSVGGLWSVLFTIASIIQMPISSLSYQVVILNSLFNFQQKKSDIEQFNSLPKTISDKLSQQKTRTKRSLHAMRRLDSIFHKHQQFENLQDKQEVEKIKLAKQIQNSIKEFFSTVSKKIRFSWFEYLTQLRLTYFNNKYRSEKYKRNQYLFSVSKMEKSMDILYIIKKLQEIDKLKAILLDKDQLKLFDYLPKPTIGVDISESEHDKHNNQYFSILRTHKSSYQSAIEAQKAFQKLSSQIDNPINVKLIKCLDEDIIDLLKMQLGDEGRQILSSPPIQKNFELDKIQEDESKELQQDICVEGQSQVKENSLKSDDDIKINELPCLYLGKPSARQMSFK